jgi:hypothetical protein
MDIVRARWSSSSFLVYAGSFVILVAVVALLIWLSADYGDPAFVGWSALVLAVLAIYTVAYERVGLEVTAGLFSFITLIAFIVFVGALEAWIGLLGGDEGPIEGFDFGRLLLYFVALLAAFVQLARYHFPLLVTVAVTASWLFVVDLISGGGDWSAVVSILVGFCFLLIGAGVDRIYGFWVQLAAGLAIGGGFLYLWHSANWEWILIGILAFFYFVLAGGLDRASYAVLGSIGLFLAWSHFVEDWFGTSLPDPIFGTSDGGGEDVWARALLYALYGFVILAIGLWLGRRRPAEAAEQLSA